MNTIKSFFEKNSFLFGNENAPSISPNNILTILRLGLLSFYETYHASIDGGSRMYTYKIIPGSDESKAFINPGIGCSHDFLSRYYSSISYTQLFLELYVVDILDNVSKNIARLKGNDTTFKQKIMDTSLKSIAIEGQTVKYSQILERLKFLIENNDNIPNDLQIPEKYHFFLAHFETLTIMQDWRNKIMHYGNQVLFYYSYEVLFVNLVFPLIKKIINVEPNTVFLNRNLHCGLNVIKELSDIKLPLDYLNIALSDDISHNLNKVNHLKELGRASFHNPLFMREYGDENLRRNYESHNSQKMTNAEIEADAIQGPLRYFQRFICPCCGTKTLMTFEYWTETKNNKTRPYKAKCILCTYTIDISIDEPNKFGIMEERIFNYID